jgi:hypothetical protein
MPSYPNRCQHIKINGTQCGSPALRRNRFCYFHKRHHDERIELASESQRNDRQNKARARRAVAIDLPVFEDANSIQVSLMQITRLLISGAIDTKTAGLILYALQTASSNLGRTRFEPRIHDVILDPARIGEIALGAHAWDDSDFLDENEDDEEYETEEDAARHRGITKAAEYLYELDRKTGGKDGFASKPTTEPPKSNSATKPDPKIDSAKKKSPASEPTAAEVREQIRQKVIKAAPALLAANPGFLQSMSKKPPAGANKPARLAHSSPQLA